MNTLSSDVPESVGPRAAPLRGAWLALLSFALSLATFIEVLDSTVTNVAVPSIKELDNQLKELAKEGRPIRTWGGRLYYVEEPHYSEEYGRDMTFEYKLLNYLLQGSGADVTKETLIRYDAHPKRKGRFVVTVYDEINFSVLSKLMSSEQKVMQECMRSIETDIPMLSDGERGPSWGRLEKFAG